MFRFLRTLFHSRPHTQVGLQSISIPPELTVKRLPLGPNCERIAKWFLETRFGMTCLGQNERTHLGKSLGGVSGEIDLIMRMNDGAQTIVFVEVRSRTQNWNVYGTPLSAISAPKRQKVCHAAKNWLNENHISLGQPVRFDVVGVIWPEGEEPQILYCPNAFKWIEPNWRRGNIRIR